MEQESGKVVIILVIVAILILAIVTVILFASNKEDPQESVQESDIPSSWLSTQNDFITVKYPPEWGIEEIPQTNQITLIENSETSILIRYFGDDFNFADGDLDDPRRQKIDLDQFMNLAKNNAAFQNIKHTTLNGYNAYEIDAHIRESFDGGQTYTERLEFTIMAENNNGQAIQIRFTNRPSKNDLTLDELTFLSSLQFS